jgi:hypothetical protein
MVFHEQFWLLLSQKSMKKQLDIELLYSVLRILLDPVKIPISTTASLIEQYLEKFEENPSNDRKLHFSREKGWSIEELVRNFKKLGINNIADMKTGYLKPKKFEEFKAVFSNKIHENTREIHYRKSIFSHLPRKSTLLPYI